MRQRDIIYVRQFRTPREERMAVIREVADWHGISVEMVLSKRRDRAIVKARHAAILAVRNRFDGDSYTQIGRLFNRDHTTVLAALRARKRQATT